MNGMGYRFEKYEPEKNGDIVVTADSPPPKLYNSYGEVMLFGCRQIAVLSFLNKIKLVGVSQGYRGFLNPITKDIDVYIAQVMTFNWFYKILLWIMKYSIDDIGRVNRDRMLRSNDIRDKNGEKVTLESLY